jgi:hypothetical protein
MSTVANAVCDDHPDRPAYKRIVGETDSFGSELIDLCQECYTAHINRVPEPITGPCAWCKKHSDNLKATRDFEEGMAGPVYDVCLPCIQNQNKIAAEDLAAFDGNDDGPGNRRGFNDDGDDDEDGFIELAPSNASEVSAVDWREETRDYTPPLVTLRSPKQPKVITTKVEPKTLLKLPGSEWPFPTSTK